MFYTLFASLLFSRSCATPLEGRSAEVVGRGVEAWAVRLRVSRSRRRLGEVVWLPRDVARKMWTVWGAWRRTEPRQAALGPEEASTSQLAE